MDRKSFTFAGPKMAICMLVFLVQGMYANLTPVKLVNRMENTVSSTVTVGSSTATHSVQLTAPSGSEKDSLVTGIVQLVVNHNTDKFAAPYDAELTVDVETWDVLGSSTMHTYTLAVRFQPYGNIAYQAEDIKLFANQSSKVYKIETTVTSMTVNGSPVTTFPDNLYLESRLEYVRYSDFTPLATTGNITSTITPIDIDCDGINESIEVLWNSVTGAVEYQLEWAFINDYDETSLSTHKAASALMVDFKNNSTRITTSGNSFVIPIVADRGYFINRVRGVGHDITAMANSIYGEWTPSAEKGLVSSYASSSYLQLTTHFEKDVNWQYNVTYAEDARHKDVISYYDGSLRNRQSITQVSTDTTTIVGETFYDFNGRPAITTLPAPIAHKTCSFTPSFNPAYSFNYVSQFNQVHAGRSLTPYSKLFFDLDISACSTLTDSMSAITGASKYYSPNNPEQNGQQAFLPDAKRYPFSQTEYTPDNTGRIRRQGGVGIDHQLGTGHETKYYYSIPNQVELDRLFGSEVGNAAHYQKNMVMDANGQISITYMDMAGKTIATALAGDPPPNLTALSSQSGANTNLTIDLFNKDANGVSITNKENYLPDAIEFNSTFMVTTQSVNTFTYNFTVDTIGDPCLKPAICFHCVYDLTIKVTDECGSQLYPSPGDSVTATVGSFTTTMGGDIQYITACSGPSQYTLPSKTFSLNLSPAAYTITKILRVNKDARDFYLGAYLSKDNNACFKDTNDFIDEALAGLDTTDCFINCSSCFQALGPKDDFVAQGRGSDLEWQAMYDECADLCGKTKTKCEIAYEQMQADMTPGGQYGEIRQAGALTLDPGSFPVSIYNPGNYLPKNLVPISVFYGLVNVTSNGASWKKPYAIISATTYTYYFGSNGQRSQITLALQPGSTLPGGYNLWVDDLSLVFTDASNGNLYTYPENLHNLEDFIQRWDPSWAKSLIYYHPEYCYYQDCIQYESKLCGDSISSEDFDRKLMMCQTYNDAVTQQLIVASGGVNDLNISMDPFISCTATYGTYGTQLAGIYNAYNSTWGSGLSMAQFAASLAHCGMQYGQSPFSVPNCTVFGYPVPGTPHVQDSVKNQEWNTLKSFYMSEKAKMQTKRSDADRLAFGSTCTIYNGCIGNKDYDPFASGMATFAFTFGVPPFHFDYTNSPYYNSQQPCNIILKSVYKEKQKRFGAMNDLKPLDADAAGYQMYVETGLCPNALDLQGLINSMAAQHKLTATGEALVNHSEFTPNLYYNLCGTTNPPYYINYNWNASISSGLDVDFYNVPAGTVDKTLHINNPAARTVDWTKVIGALQMDVTSTSGGVSYFNITLKHHDNPGDSVSVITTTGNTSIILDGCKFQDVCTANDFAKDLQTLMTAMKTTPNNTSADIYSTSGINLSASSTYSLLLTPALLNIIGTPTTTPQYTWKNSSTNVFQLYDAHNSCKIVITLGATTPTALPTAAIASIASFKNITCDYQNFFKIDGYSTSNTFIATIRASVVKICGTQTVGISMGNCGQPTPLACQTAPHENRADLELLLTDILQGHKYVPESGTGISDVLANTDFTDNLRSLVSPLPATIIASTYTTSGYSYIKNYPVIHDTTTGTLVYNDSLVIPFYGEGAPCPLVLKTNNAPYKTAVSLSYPMTIKKMVAYGTPGTGGNLNQFYLVTEFVSPTTGLHINDTLYGSSCFAIQNCNTCGDTALSCCGTPTMGGRMAAPSSPDSCAINLGHARQNGDIALYKTYVSSLADLNGRLGYAPAHKNYIPPAPLAAFYDERTGVYKGLEAYAGFVRHFDPALDNKEFLLSPKKFFKVNGTSINPVAQYMRYKKALAGYNRRASAAGTATVTPVPSPVFYRKHMADSIHSVISLLQGKPGEQPAAKVKQAQPLLFVTHVDDNIESDTCRTAYYMYLDAYSAYQTYQDSLGIYACDTVPFYSESDFISRGYCCFSNFPAFYSYDNTFYNHLVCPDTIRMQGECTDTTECKGLYTAYINIINLYNASDFAIGNNLYLSNQLFPNEAAFNSLGYCACVRTAYDSYMSVYTHAPADSALPPPLKITEFGGCGPPKNIDPCLGAYAQYTTAVNNYNNFASLHTGYTMISTLYNSDQFTASGYCYCEFNYARFLQAATKLVITDTVYIRENLSIGVYCKPDTLTCKHPHSSDTLLSPPLNPEINPCVKYKRDLAKANGLLKYQQYADSLTTEFVKLYNQRCLTAAETFNRNYDESEFHHTLYYYDQAGNLVRTIPPEGIDEAFFSSITSTSSTNEIAAQTDRAYNTHNLLTDHGLATTYLYNSLNQLVRQNLPDHDPMSYTNYQYAWGIDTAANIVSSQFPSSNKGYMAGNVAISTAINLYFPGLIRGMAYETTDGGINWQLVPGITGAGIRKVQFVTTGLNSYTVGLAVGTDGTFMVSYDNGNTWDLVPIHSSVLNKNLTDLSFNVESGNDKIDGVIVGEQGTALKVRLDVSASPVFTALTGLSTNDSITSITSLPGASNAVDYFISTWNTSTKQASIFTGNNTAIASLTSWTDISAARADNLAKVCRIPGTANYFAGGKEGMLIKFDNATSKWNKVLTGTKADFKDLYFIDDTHGIAILKSASIAGDLYKTTDGGHTWSLLDGGNTSTDEYVSLNAYIKASVSGSFSTDKLVACGTAGLVKRISLIKNTVSNTCQFGAVNTSISTSNTINSAMALAYNGGSQYYVLAGGNSGALYANPDYSQNTITWNTVSAGSINIQKIMFDIKSPAAMSSSTKINGVLIETDGTLSRVVSSSLTAVPVTYTVGSILSGTGSYTFTDMATLESPVVPGSISNVYMLGGDGTNSKVAVLDLSTALISTSAPADITGGQVSSVTGFNSLAMRSNDDAVLVGNAGIIYSNKGNTLPGAFGTWINESATVQLSKINDLSIAGVSGSAELIAVGDQGLYAQRPLSGSYAQVKNTGVLNHLNAVQNYSVSGSNSYGAIAGGSGFVARYTSTSGNNTLSSTPVANPVTVSFNDVLVNLSSNLAYAAGNSGKAVSISNFTTTPVATAINTNTTKNLRGLSYMPGSSNALALSDQMQNFVLSSGMAMKSKYWFVNEVTKLHFTNALNGYMVGMQGLIRHTTDGGNTWSVAKPFYTVSNTVTNYYLVYTTANDKAMIGGDNRYFAPLNNLTLGTAITYSLSAPQVFRDMDMNVSGIGYAVGTNTANSKAIIAKTTDGGLTWTGPTVPSTILGARAVHVFKNGDCIAVGINKSVFRYDYGTSTLLLVTQPTPGSSSLIFNDVYFHDDKTGYIAADKGYVFSTADYANIPGTATWNTVPISDRWLSSIDAPDVNIKTISFYSRYDGFMGGDHLHTDKHARNFHDESSTFSTLFWYDRLGRMVISQNTKQRHKTPLAYSYTRYDALGRISEVGEKADTAQTFETIFGTYINTMYNTHAIDDARMVAWITGSGARTEVTKTYYDSQVILNTSLLAQQNLRKRVATSTYEDYDDGKDTTYNSASHYSYDIHGNVSTLLQENRTLVYADSVPSGNPAITLHHRHAITTYNAQRYKRMDYDYDLISGKVNLVSYQPGQADAFYHRYGYDADNRITNVETSRNGITWENDAKYFYYKHGPLARVELGHDKVQGMDYAYTIEGWIKGVNSNALSPQLDMGQDGAATGGSHLIGRDAMGYTLRYFSGDYDAINSNWSAVGNRFEARPDASVLALRKDLYNGNISLTGTTIVDAAAYAGISSTFTMTPKPLSAAYTYDQLNRVMQAHTSENLSAFANQWDVSAISSNLYANSFTYDANGNIMRQDKYDDAGTALDGIDYYYNTSGSSGGRLKQNRLYGIGENISTTTYSLDIETPGFSAFNYGISTINSANNYGYDELGNLTRDGYEEIDTMRWTVYGKLKAMARNSGSLKKDLKFDYDASGNRIAKHAYDNSGTWLGSTYYVRDAQGNVMSTYTNENIAGPAISYRAVERDLYGSSRLGVDHNEVELIGGSGPNLDSAQRILGNKQYELTNHLGNVLTVVSDKKIPVADSHTCITCQELKTVYTDYVSANAAISPSNISAFASYANSQLSLSNTAGDYLQALIDCGLMMNVLNFASTQVESNTAAGFSLGTSDLTVEAWARFTSTSGFNMLVDNTQVISGNPRGFHLFVYNGYLYFAVYEGSTSYPLMQSNATLSTGQWMHIAATKAGFSTATYSLYINGNPIAFTAVANPTAPDMTAMTNSVTLRIGVNKAGGVPTDYMNGNIRNVRIHKRALADYEVGADYSNGCMEDDGVGGSLVYSANLDEGTGTTITDLSGNNLTSTITNGTWTYEAVPDTSCLTTADLHRQLCNFVSTLTSSVVSYYIPEVLTSTDYYAFGQPMPGRNFTNGSSYRYGMNGKEKDDELKGDGNSYDFGARMYDPRLGKWLSIDPLQMKYPAISPYAFVMNTPIQAHDPDGRDVIFLIDHDGAGNNGHMAALIQDKSGNWFYYSQGAAEEGGSSGQFGFVSGKSVKGGVTLLPMIMKNDKGDIIQMTKEQALAVVNQGIQIRDTHYEEGAHLETTKDQDDQIYKNAVDLQKKHDSKEKEYNLYTNNCVDAVQDAVQNNDTGIDLPNDYSPKPNSYFEKVKEFTKSYKPEVPLQKPQDNGAAKQDNLPVKITPKIKTDAQHK